MALDIGSAIRLPEQTPPPARCPHQPACPPAEAADRDAAACVACHPEQGWWLLCNGVVSFEDTGSLLPDGRALPPHRPTDRDGQVLVRSADLR